MDMTTARALPTDALAPWAEIVPGYGAMTVADLVALPDDEVWRYEVVDGVLVRVGSSVYKATRLAGRLFATLLAFVLTHDLGDVTPPDGTYDLDASGQSTTGLVPDVGFIRAELLPRINPDKAIPFAPDLAIEVASDNQYRPAMGRKAARYLDAGSRLVWIIYPRWRQVDVWHPGDIVPTTLNIGDTLSGENVVPGFSHPVATLFV